MESPADPVGPLRPRVQHALDEFLNLQRAALEPVSADLLPLLDAATGLLRGGKRLRPAFCYWGWVAAGGSSDDEPIVTAASALELFQAAALVHDDVIDESDTRRGEPSVHQRFAARHREHGWRGDPDKFGRAAAILLGDLLLGWSDELLCQAGLDETALQRARPVFELMRTEVGAGQYLDILAQADVDSAAPEQVKRAHQVIVHKAARYTVVHPLALGGQLARGSGEVLGAFSTYGSALGEAFQLRDDILGVFGDPAVTGKPAGDDLREGKRTMLVAYALERADTVQARIIAELLGNPHLDDAGVHRLQEILSDTGALGRVEARIDSLVEDAIAAIDQATVTDDGRTALSHLVALTTARSH
ncbi:polyprenyl synthetase family protein [Actinobacteria bacterium YIM 96077]|uniref:Polyprenyl synthetase family protein n=1 Tax=Phytoactinopolyspora halophila TaxID=1981511 RepID=A0A329QJR6_9ACTN|nr:polyprenyl synthetase family protein [Actinobacteria bacterium YIM 96077]RAW12466.1 polyprenyl synthetase family protein [Phytoactinopolyspora halophila]